jgi:hypothetical protein
MGCAFCGDTQNASDIALRAMLTERKDALIINFFPQISYHQVLPGDFYERHKK